MIKVKYHTDIDPIVQQPWGDWIDLRTAEEVTMKQGDFKIISLGVSMKLPPGCEAIVAPRSSTFKSWGVLQTNGIGIIDNTYCGDDDVWGFPALATRDITIPKNTRICQFRLQSKMPLVGIETVEHLSDANRGGWGSTGKE